MGGAFPYGWSVPLWVEHGLSVPLWVERSLTGRQRLAGSV